MPLYEGFSSLPEKLIVIVDIGAAYTKVGFSGECAPRWIIRSEVSCKKKKCIRNVVDYEDEQDLYDLLVEFVHILYFKYVLLSPKDRPVVIVESLLCPTLFRETLAKVLFSHYEVSSLLVLPSHLVSLAPLGIDTALVLDVGYTEATAIPVCHGVPILNAWQALPLGSKVVHHNIKTLLSASNTGINNVTERNLEDVKVRCCFVTKQNRAEQLQLPNSGITSCPDVKYPLDGSKLITVPGKLRETAFEVFFEEDNDHQCITTMLLDVLLKVNVDLRVKLAENILFIGGTCMTTGFKARIKEELYRQLKNEKYQQLKVVKFKFHVPPCKDNYTAWLGAAVYASTDILSMKSFSKENYLKENRLPDWVDMRDNRAL